MKYKFTQKIEENPGRGGGGGGGATSSPPDKTWNDAPER